MTTKCYSWTCDDRCLYYKDVLVCCKSNGIFYNNSAFIKQLREPFRQLNITSYTFNNSISEYESLISAALHRFYECAMAAEWIEPVILNLVRTLNIRYENKYLNYCRSLDIDKFIEVTKKHNKRKSVVKERTFTGLWYS